jgi:hypothetical protein
MNNHSQQTSQQHESSRVSVGIIGLVQESVPEVSKLWLGRDYRYVRFEEWQAWTKDTRFWLRDVPPCSAVLVQLRGGTTSGGGTEPVVPRTGQWYSDCWLNTTSPTTRSATSTFPVRSHAGTSARSLSENPPTSWLDELDAWFWLRKTSLATTRQ